MITDDFFSTIARVEAKVRAYDVIAERSTDAHEYCHKYLLLEALGRNTWHAILDDAIRMRKELNKKNSK